MFGMGMPEILLILAVALVVIGPKKLPDLARSLGRAMNEFKRAASELKDTMDIDDDLQNVKRSFTDMNRNVKKAIDTAPQSESGSEEDRSEKTGEPPALKSKKTKPAVPAAPGRTSEVEAEEEEDELATDIPGELSDEYADSVADADTGETGQRTADAGQNLKEKKAAQR